MSQETPEVSPQQPGGVSLQSPLDVALASSGLMLQEAVNLGEINPAMARRFAERTDQIFKALMRGAGVHWSKDGDLKIVYPEVENPILAAAKARKAERKTSTAMPHQAGIPEDIEQANENA